MKAVPRKESGLPFNKNKKLTRIDNDTGMDHFNYQKGVLFCEEVPVEAVANTVGTPFYLYSSATFTRHFRAFEQAFSSRPHLICFAVKANSNLGVLNLLAGLGSGADIVSGGELYRALRAGIPGERIVYSGVGKTRGEMEQALSADILMFNVESIQELELLDATAQAMGKRARISLRVNPDVDPKTHPYISTGLKKNKFGLPMKDARQIYTRAAKMKGLEVVGIDCHIGSQLTDVDPFVDALDRVKVLVMELEAQGIPLRYIDVGGGLGITYRDESPPEPDRYAHALLTHLKHMPHTLILEPGRAIAGNAGILVTRVLYTKDTGEKRFYIVDAGMNDLARPSLYEAYHQILPVRQIESEESLADVVGPICETGDFLARERPLPQLVPGSLLAVRSAGAYGFTMSSNYNSRPRIPEVLVNGDRFCVVRERETVHDLVALENIPDEQCWRSV